MSKRPKLSNVSSQTSYDPQPATRTMAQLKALKPKILELASELNKALDETELETHFFSPDKIEVHVQNLEAQKLNQIEGEVLFCEILTSHEVRQLSAVKKRVKDFREKISGPIGPGSYLFYLRNINLGYKKHQNSWGRARVAKVIGMNPRSFIVMKEGQEAKVDKLYLVERTSKWPGPDQFYTWAEFVAIVFAQDNRAEVARYVQHMKPHELLLLGQWMDEKNMKWRSENEPCKD